MQENYSMPTTTCTQRLFMKEAQILSRSDNRFDDRSVGEHCRVAGAISNVGRPGTPCWFRTVAKVQRPSHSGWVLRKFHERGVAGHAIGFLCAQDWARCCLAFRRD